MSLTKPEWSGAPATGTSSAWSVWKTLSACATAGTASATAERASSLRIRSTSASGGTENAAGRVRTLDHCVREHQREEHDRDDAVHREEGHVEPAQVARADERVLV